MAVIGIGVETAFQPDAFQYDAFQIDVYNLLDAAGDFATPQELAALERKRRKDNIRQRWLERAERRAQRKFDAMIDRIIAGREPVEGERPEAEIPASAKPPANAKPANHLRRFVELPPAFPTAIGNQLRSHAPIELPKRPRQRIARQVNALHDYTANQTTAQQAALQQLLTLPTKPARMSPDQLLAALAQGQREMARLRGY